MEPLTREQLEFLIDLQAKETEATHIRTELDRLPEKIAAMEKGLSAFHEAVEARKAVVRELKKTYRAEEADLEMNQSRVQKREIQLHSVKTNKEYQSILKEIDEIRSANSRIEDRMIQRLDEIDTAEKEISLKDKELAVEKQKIEAEISVLNEAAGRQQKILDQLLSEAGKIADQLDPKLKKHYNSIRSRSGGLAIVPVNNAVCQGCHLNIPPQMYNELHRGNELRFCPHCYRMIYVL